MLDILLEKIKGIITSRILPLLLVYFTLFALLIIRLFQIQVVEKEELTEDTEEQVTKDREIKATRGNIYDRNGYLLAYNELSYTVTLEDVGAFSTNDEKNAMIHQLIQIIEKNGGEIVTEFYLALDSKNRIIFTVDGMAELRFKKNAYAKKSVNDLTEEEKNATAKEVYEFLRTGPQMFGISDEYSVEDTLKIMNIRYAMFMNTYAKYLPISIATNVNEKTVAAIKENTPDLPGVEILTETHRIYNDSEYFAHILGYTGLLNDTELENDEEKYYSATDQIGKTGLERTFEEYLRGEKGKEVVALNSSYRVTEVLDTIDPVAGNDIYLTLDSTLQKACYHILERNLAAILLSRIHSGTSYGGKGEIASKITIPIYDVYYALIYNNIIDLNRLKDKEATATEKAVYKKYQTKENSIRSSLKQVMGVNSTTTKKAATSEIREYLEYIYNFLAEQGYLLTSEIDTEDSTYKDYQNDKISLSAFLQYAISSNWVNLTKIGIDDSYYSTEEIYQLLLDKTLELLPEDANYNKMIYKTLVYSYQLTGREICLLLFDQGILAYDENDVTKLKNGIVSPYTFLRSKISSLEITPADLALDPCSGSMVINNPKTGEVLAMVTYPSYDNNMLANRINAEYYSKLQNDNSFPMINRPTQQKTAPGSTFKMITGIAALEEGVVDLGETVMDEVVYKKQGTPATCWSNRSHGKVNIRTALEVSCNYYFYEMGYRLSLDKTGNYNSGFGLQKLADYAAKFGLAQGELSGVEVYETEPSISDIDSIRSAIGQGSFAFTPTQISRYVSTIANDGICGYLTIIDHISDIDGNPIDNTISVAANTEKKDIPKVELKQSTWDAIKDGMYLVINGPDSDYSDMFEEIDVEIAGKTGTAQFTNLRGNHALFTSYAPYDDPELVVTIVVPYAYTSTNAAMIAAEFYEYYYGKKDLKEAMEGEVDASRASSVTSLTD